MVTRDTRQRLKRRERCCGWGWQTGRLLVAVDGNGEGTELGITQRSARQQSGKCPENTHTYKRSQGRAWRIHLCQLLLFRQKETGGMAGVRGREDRCWRTWVEGMGLGALQASWWLVQPSWRTILCFLIIFKAIMSQVVWTILVFVLVTICFLKMSMERKKIIPSTLTSNNLSYVNPQEVYKNIYVQECWLKQNNS